MIFAVGRSSIFPFIFNIKSDFPQFETSLLFPFCGDVSLYIPMTKGYKMKTQNHWSMAASAVWELVCGLPNAKRRKRLILPLKAYIDDSGSHRDSPVFVLAGYIAPAERWAAFSDAWQRVLDMPMPLEYFKMHEAYQLSGQFNYWSESRRDERLRLFWRVIEEHVSAIISCAFPLADYARVVRGLPLINGDPYYFAASQLMSVITQEQKNLGFDEPIDFIFDDQVMHKTTFIEEWEKQTKNVEHPLKGSMPQFLDDKKFLPLQAADLEAWWLRRRWEEKLTGIPRLDYPWQPDKKILELSYSHNENTLKVFFDRLMKEAGYKKLNDADIISIQIFPQTGEEHLVEILSCHELDSPVSVYLEASRQRTLYVSRPF